MDNRYTCPPSWSAADQLRGLVPLLGVQRRAELDDALDLVSVLTGGAGVLAYLAAWAIIPDEGQKSSIAENIVSKKQDAWSG
jgi:hypothetical protein